MLSILPLDSRPKLCERSRNRKLRSPNRLWSKRFPQPEVLQPEKTRRRVRNRSWRHAGGERFVCRHRDCGRVFRGLRIWQEGRSRPRPSLPRRQPPSRSLRLRRCWKRRSSRPDFPIAEPVLKAAARSGQSADLFEPVLQWALFADGRGGEGRCRDHGGRIAKARIHGVRRPRPDRRDFPGADRAARRTPKRFGRPRKRSIRSVSTASCGNISPNARYWSRMHAICASTLFDYAVRFQRFDSGFDRQGLRSFGRCRWWFQRGRASCRWLLLWPRLRREIERTRVVRQQFWFRAMW